ncbi:16S rRNA pseudouridine(516) synthase [Aerococcaceae bacterium zg-ZUI334]|uniref:16S rRNA pseudouridine(516) synthase n=1 Tax=Aerococcaceae bacterium zg-252 TaxID=2796928 RepID=UPI001BA18E1C|nr:16S rRNA pseudouridine(516) synthase [Aerococcaceae bacterium zg-ZUI334]
MRLDKLLIQTKNYSKKQRKKMLAEGEILVDAKVANSLRQNVDSHLQEIVVKGERLVGERERYYLMNKPKGVISAVTDDEMMTVIDLMNEKMEVTGLYPVGRLDRDTSGILLITNNGPLGFCMLHPDYHVDKTYEVIVNGKLGEEEQQRFLQGIVFDDGYQCRPSQLEILSAQEHQSVAHVTISEGKFHQVKKMFLSVGVKVVELKRIVFGSFTLDSQLAPGEYRELTTTELGWIKEYLE